MAGGVGRPALAKSAWNLFVVICLLVVDGPQFVQNVATSGIVVAMRTVIATAVGWIIAEPMGFVALVIALALGLEKARPLMERLRLRWLA